MGWGTGTEMGNGKSRVRVGDAVVVTCHVIVWRHVLVLGKQAHCGWMHQLGIHLQHAGHHFHGARRVPMAVPMRLCPRQRACLDRPVSSHLV